MEGYDSGRGLRLIAVGLLYDHFKCLVEKLLHHGAKSAKIPPIVSSSRVYSS